MTRDLGRIVLILLLASFIVACSSQSGQKTADQSNEAASSGQQIIVASGSISKDLVGQMIEKSGIRKGGYVVIIPTTYQANSKSAKSLRKAFYDQEIMAVHILNLLAESRKSGSGLAIKKSDILAIENARIVCMLDGNENQFMHFARKTQLKQALINARENAALIAGFGKSAPLLCDFRFILKNDTVEQQPSMVLSKGLELLNNTVVDDIQLLNKQSKSLLKKIQNKEITFIGLNKNSAVWINDQQATVIGKPKVAFAPYNGKVSRLSQGDGFQLDQKAEWK